MKPNNKKVLKGLLHFWVWSGGKYSTRLYLSTGT